MILNYYYDIWQLHYVKSYLLFCKFWYMTSKAFSVIFSWLPWRLKPEAMMILLVFDHNNNSHIYDITNALIWHSDLRWGSLFSFIFFLVSQNYYNIGDLLNIMFIFDRGHCSYAAMTPAKYEHKQGIGITTTPSAHRLEKWTASVLLDPQVQNCDNFAWAHYLAHWQAYMGQMGKIA